MHGDVDVDVGVGVDVDVDVDGGASNEREEIGAMESDAEVDVDGITRLARMHSIPERSETLQPG